MQPTNNTNNTNNPIIGSPTAMHLEPTLTPPDHLDDKSVCDHVPIHIGTADDGTSFYECAVCKLSWDT